MPIPSVSLAEIQRALLTWWRDHRRDLPWRRTQDPYAILVSEVMLQQTGVERVLPKYGAFLERFPTVAILAMAPTAEVIRLWGGLGYNRRAVHLQRAAQMIMGEYHGSVPADVNALVRLPGVGPYTARAVACFAFNAQVPVVDTNIRRVLTRLLEGHEGVSPVRTPHALLAQAASLLPSGQAYAWNQGLMDLGALVCTATHPACLLCPLQAYCAAFPSILSGPRVADERPHWKAGGSPFRNSRRYYRGRIVDALRAAPHTGLTITDLGRSIKGDYTAADEAWLRDLLASLEADGLVRVHGQQVYLP
jgi:A/G-specific adenine glycosylase